MSYNPNDHPRNPKGTPQGGQFTTKPGVGGDDDLTTPNDTVTWVNEQLHDAFKDSDYAVKVYDDNDGYAKAVIEDDRQTLIVTVDNNRYITYLEFSDRNPISQGDEVAECSANIPFSLDHIRECVWTAHENGVNEAAEFHRETEYDYYHNFM